MLVVFDTADYLVSSNLFLETVETLLKISGRVSGFAQHPDWHQQPEQSQKRQITSTSSDYKIVKHFLLKHLPYYCSIRVSPRIMPWMANDVKESY